MTHIIATICASFLAGPVRAGGAGVRRRDHTEALANAIVGLAISTALVWLLRAVGLWDAPALAVSSVFFAASVGRSYALRRVFRRGEDA